MATIQFPAIIFYGTGAGYEIPRPSRGSTDLWRKKSEHDSSVTRPSWRNVEIVAYIFHVAVVGDVRIFGLSKFERTDSRSVRKLMAISLATALGYRYLPFCTSSALYFCISKLYVTPSNCLTDTVNWRISLAMLREAIQNAWELDSLLSSPSSIRTFFVSLRWSLNEYYEWEILGVRA